MLAGRVYVLRERERERRKSKSRIFVARAYETRLIAHNPITLLPPGIFSSLVNLKNL